MSLLNIAVNDEGVVINLTKGITRDCGNCVACCVWAEIKEIDKPPLTPCQHLKEKAVEGETRQSCEIYETRPSACKDYFCSWLIGFGEDEDQPNKSGVLMDTQVTAEHGLVLFARDLWPGATDMEMGKRAIQRISEEMHLLVMVTDTAINLKRIEGPAELVQRIRKKQNDNNQ